MAIAPSEAARIHRLAQDAGIDDDTLADWTEEEGGYRFAITSGTGAIKSLQAHRLTVRIKEHSARKEAAAVGVPPGTPMATPAQIEHILRNLARRQRTGDAGGFMTGPTDRDGIARMTRREASKYITSLTEDY
ncbi:hypothetical protein [Streptomyces sp. CAU 1734]|uniref:hypothetical protein n=1 Tax=Streptomyces sp. CAU 1734 TaxID=3140360 RepID=UPI0032614239